MSTLSTESEAWLARAICAGLPPDLFHPTDAIGVEEAKEICRGCPVRIECLTYAIEHHEEFGVWGGTSERGRRRVARLHRRSGITIEEALRRAR